MSKDYGICNCVYLNFTSSELSEYILNLEKQVHTYKPISLSIGTLLAILLLLVIFILVFPKRRKRIQRFLNKHQTNRSEISDIDALKNATKNPNNNNNNDDDVSITLESKQNSTTTSSGSGSRGNANRALIIYDEDYYLKKKLEQEERNASVNAEESNSAQIRLPRLTLTRPSVDLNTN